MELDKEKRIKKEKNKLKKIFANIQQDRKSIVEKLIENAAFMAAALEDLQRAINLNGCISEYQNGENQWGTKKAPEVEIYNTMIKNYTTVVKQLTELIPSTEEIKTDGDGFESFIDGREDL